MNNSVTSITEDRPTYECLGISASANTQVPLKDLRGTMGPETGSNHYNKGGIRTIRDILIMGGWGSKSMRQDLMAIPSTLPDGGFIKPAVWRGLGVA